MQESDTHALEISIIISETPFILIIDTICLTTIK